MDCKEQFAVTQTGAGLSSHPPQWLLPQNTQAWTPWASTDTHSISDFRFDPLV